MAGGHGDRLSWVAKRLQVLFLLKLCDTKRCVQDEIRHFHVSSGSDATSTHTLLFIVATTLKPFPAEEYPFKVILPRPVCKWSGKHECFVFPVGSSHRTECCRRKTVARHAQNAHFSAASYALSGKRLREPRLYYRRAHWK